MRWEQPVQYASLSDIGFRRRNNQDSCIVQICSDRETWQQRGHLFLVADGMGGHAVGELASKIAVDTVPHTFYKLKGPETLAALKAAIDTTNTTIYERGAHNRDFERMGTTCTALVLSPQGAVIGHVGDSRVYRIRNERIDQLSFDHSLQWELIRQGKMDPEEVFLHQPRNVITRSLGPEQTVKIDTEGPYSILPGDTYLLCSDGLTGHVNDSEIGQIAANFSPGEACRMLVHLANLRGGSDNITIVIARVGDVPAGLPAVEPRAEPEQAGGLNRMQLSCLWAIAVSFVAAVSLVIIEKVVEGVVLGTLVLVVAAVLLIRWWRNRPPPAVSRDLAETTLWRPYRTASAQFDRKFLSHLAAVEADLQRSATEEGWSIDWPQHEAAFNAAKTAINQQQEQAAFRHYAKAIDVLMAGVQLHRKQMNREAKWGKTSSSAPQSSNG